MKISGLDQKTNIISTNNVLTDSYIIMNCTETVQDEVTQTIQSKPITYKVSLGELGNALINTFKIVTYDNENGNKKLNTINNNYVATQIGNFVTGELNVDNISGFGANKTLAGLTETDGLISASFQDIAIANTQVSGLGTAAVKDVPTSGNASTTQIVMGNDSRLTDSRNAKDVQAWAKAANKPSYTAEEVGVPAWARATNKPSYTLTELTNIPALPSEDGTYTLQVTIDNGEATYSWI